MSPGAPFDSALAKVGLVSALVVAMQLRHQPRMSAGAMARGVAVGALGALPATLLVLPTIPLGASAADALQEGRDLPFFGMVVAWTLLALLGAAGLWLASVRPPSVASVAMIACGLVAHGVVLADALLSDPRWFVPRALDEGVTERLVMIAPFVASAAYVASVLAPRRQPSEARAGEADVGEAMAA